MSEPQDFIEKRLRRLAAATAAVRPAAGFDDWIVAAAERRSGLVWLDGLRRSGRVAIAVAALAAAASAALALHARDELDDQVLTAFELVELDE
ncbi:MAG: hypothetical protein HY744_11760 [Deltaproteobacteria bacterium]|nr:hypothetical protein [Deltaproteobacteria bacterium]